MLHLKDNIKLIRALLKQTQPEFIKNFTGKITVDMQKSYESGKAKPDILYVQELTEMTGIPERELTSKKLIKGDLKAMVEKVDKGEKNTHNSDINQGFQLLIDKKEFYTDVLLKLRQTQATVNVLKLTVAKLAASKAGSKIDEELDWLQTLIDEEADKLLEKDKLKYGLLFP